MKLPNLPLSYKVFIVLIAVPLLFMGIYSWRAIELFGREKRTSSESAQSRVASSLLAYTRSVIDGKATELRAIASGFDQDTLQFSPVAQARFNQNPAISLAGVFNKTESGFVSQAIMERDEGARIKSLLLSKLNSKEWRKHGRLTFLPLDEKMAALVLTQTSNYLVVLIFDAQDLLALYNDSETVKVRLISQYGSTILAPQRDHQNFVRSPILKEIDFADNSLQPIRLAGQEEVAYIAAPVTSIDAVLLSTVTQPPFNTLSRRMSKQTLFFFIALVSIALLFSLDASRRKQQELRVQIEHTSNYISANAHKMAQSWVTETRREEEIKMAQFAKQTLYPKKLEADLGSVRIAGFLEAPDEYRADWWHYSEKDDQVLIWIGDTSGHGTQSALTATATKTVATLANDMSCFDPATVMNMLNQAVFGAARGKITMSFFLARIDKKKGELTYCNASHEPALLAPHLGRALHKEDFVWLNESHGSRLGEGTRSKYTSTTIKIQDGATLFSYSDGVARTRNMEGAKFGERRLFNLAQTLGNEGVAPSDWVQALRNELGEFRKGQPLKDDVTFVVSQYKPSHASESTAH